MNSMRKKIQLLVLTLFVSASVFAQRPDREKIKTLKIAHITEQLDLTKNEAEKFWPIYNANEEAENKLRSQVSENRKLKNPEDLSEAEAKELLLDMIAIEKQKVELHSKMIKDLMDVLPAKKIVALNQAERSFRRKMLDEYKKRQGGGKHN